VKVAETSMDMFTPPCSPNSWRPVAGSSHVGSICCFLVVMKFLPSKASEQACFLSEKTKLWVFSPCYLSTRVFFPHTSADIKADGAGAFLEEKMHFKVTCNSRDRLSVQTDERMDGLYFLPRVGKFEGVISKIWYIGGYIARPWIK